MQSVSKGFSSFSKGVSNVLPGGEDRRNNREFNKRENARDAARIQSGWDDMSLEEQKEWVREGNDLSSILRDINIIAWKRDAGLSKPSGEMIVQRMGDSGYQRSIPANARSRSRSRSRGRSRSRSRTRSRGRSRSRSRTRSRSRSRTGGRK